MDRTRPIFNKIIDVSKTIRRSKWSTLLVNDEFEAFAYEAWKKLDVTNNKNKDCVEKKETEIAQIIGEFETYFDHCKIKLR